MYDSVKILRKRRDGTSATFIEFNNISKNKADELVNQWKSKLDTNYSCYIKRKKI